MSQQTDDDLLCDQILEITKKIAESYGVSTETSSEDYLQIAVKQLSQWRNHQKNIQQMSRAVQLEWGRQVDRFLETVSKRTTT